MSVSVVGRSRASTSTPKKPQGAYQMGLSESAIGREFDITVSSIESGESDSGGV